MRRPFKIPFHSVCEGGCFQADADPLAKAFSSSHVLMSHLPEPHATIHVAVHV